MVAPSPTLFHEVGTVTDQIEVEITYQIIGLFSEGLYSSPNKAIEELVSNSFDADADTVDVVVSKDLREAGSSIAVFDNGIGMDPQGLKIHWIVGDSVKRRTRLTPTGRTTIGKFGIGKLAAYVLGQRLTHISLSKGVYSSTTMDFGKIPVTVNLPDVAKPDQQSNITQGPVRLDLRTLTEDEAHAALQPWLDVDGGRNSLRMFGPDAATSWTAAVISDLKPMAEELSLGRLRWVLSTAMPLRDDFHLYLNEQLVAPSKDAAAHVGRWVLAKDLVEVPRPAPSELASEVDAKIGEDDYKHWYLVDKTLGPISGYLEVFQDPIDTGKSAEVIGRSNGFFVYVHGRLTNPDDPGFGIDRNTLRHGTFSRFRVVIHINRLDEALRSSRESLREGPELKRARDLLQGIFNFARTKLDDYQAAQESERKVSQRLADSPASLSERPILHLILDTFEGKAPSRHVTVPDPSQFVDAAALRSHIEHRIEDGVGLVAEVVFADLGSRTPIAVLDAVSGVLSINLEHPFVAHFADEFNDRRKNLPLQLFAVSEITLEAQLRAAAIPPGDIDTVLTERDDLLRHLARDTGRRNSITVAQELLSSASSKKELEEALVAAFNQLGFEAVPKGAKNDPDGIADAYLPPTEGALGPYRVSLEAKSKETVGAKVKKSAVEVSTIARHRDDNHCQHAIVVGPEFETGKEDDGAVIQEIDDDRASHGGKTITLMEIRDLARLVRNAPVKRINLAQIRDLFQARTPAEASAWVDSILAIDPSQPPYKDILEVVWAEQQTDSYTVNYSALRVALRTTRSRVMSDEDLRNDCTALAQMAPNLFFAHKDSVELNTKPEKVLEAIHGYIEQVPKEPE